VAKTTIPENDSRQLVYFAAERTLMAWIRCALALMALGFALDRFGMFLRQAYPEQGHIIMPKTLTVWSGSVVVGLGALFALVATFRYGRFYRAYTRDRHPEVSGGILLGSFFSGLIGLAGVALAIFMFVTLD